MGSHVEGLEDEEEAAAFEGMGRAVAELREKRGMDRAELAAKSEMTETELREIETGKADEWWGGIRLIAKALGMPPGALMIEAEESAPGPGGEAWRQNNQEAAGDGTAPKARSDATKP